MPRPIASFLTFLLSLPLVAQEAKADVTALRKEATAAVQSQDWGVAAAAFKKLTEANPKDGRSWHMLGYSLHAAGKLDEALPAHMKATEFPESAALGAYNAGCVYALKKDKDKAFDWLEKAVGFGFGQVDQLDTDTDLDSLRGDARFGELRKHVEAKAASNPGQVFAITTDRRCARVVLFGKDAPQLALDYGPVPWHDKFEAEIDRQVGKKWRFGSDFWTSLDASMPCQLGGVAVPAGYYYLTIENKGERKFVLSLHDAAAVKKARVDAFMAEKLEGGIQVPLAHAKAAGKAERLDVAFQMEAGLAGKLVIRFGDHELTAPVVLAPAK